MRQLALVMHNVRSTHNVGSMLRTAEGFKVNRVYMTGYTPYPEAKNDDRLPHIRQKTALQLHKTALGAEHFVSWRHEPDINKCLADLLKAGFLLVALEQTADSIDLDEFNGKGDVALIVGNEISGLESSVLNKVDMAVQIPMKGRKESFNVAVAAGIALYQLSYPSRQE